MRRPTALLPVLAAAAIAAPTAGAALVRVGSPPLSTYRGAPVAVVFFHPL